MMMTTIDLVSITVLAIALIAKFPREDQRKEEPAVVPIPIENKRQP